MSPSIVNPFEQLSIEQLPDSRQHEVANLSGRRPAAVPRRAACSAVRLYRSTTPGSASWCRPSCSRSSSFSVLVGRSLFSNRIVAWKTFDRCDTELVLGALAYAV